MSSSQILPLSLPLSVQQHHTNTGSNSSSCHLGEFGDTMVSMLPTDLPFTLFLPSSPAFCKFLRLDPALSLAPETLTLNNTLTILSRVLAFSAVPQHLPAGALPVRTPSRGSSCSRGGTSTGWSSSMVSGQNVLISGKGSSLFTSLPGCSWTPNSSNLFYQIMRRTHDLTYPTEITFHSFFSFLFVH